MTKLSAIEPAALARRLVLLVAITACVLTAIPAARAAAYSIVACDGAAAAPSCTSSAATIPAAHGVFFEVTTGGGNRGYISVEVTCDNGYGTILNVLAEPKSGGTSQTIYPPPGVCVANLEKQMAIGKAHVLATVTFTVS